VCGCGVADTDTDGDGASDCLDLCPADPYKLAPEVCGCGEPDTHSDADGVADCYDECPTDSAKVEAGVCGCWVSDVDESGTPWPACPVGPASCLEILELDPGAPDGDYTVDPDGAGEAPRMRVRCDMTNGGFTILSVLAFDGGKSAGFVGTDGKETPVDTASKCATSLGAMLGGAGILGGGGAYTQRHFALYGIPHEELWLSLEYVVIDSWDKEEALVLVDGQVGYREKFDSADATTNICAGKKRDHGSIPVSLRVPHTEPTALVRITSTLDSGPDDEAFGVRNLILRIR
jgi:hypothetical protein